MERNEFTDLARMLSELLNNDDDGFKRGLIRAMDSMNLLDSDLSKEFGVSRPTVNRWRNGTSIPHPAVRRPILSYLAHRATKLAARARSTGTSSQTEQHA